MGRYGGGKVQKWPEIGDVVYGWPLSTLGVAACLFWQIGGHSSRFLLCSSIQRLFTKKK